VSGVDAVAAVVAKLETVSEIGAVYNMMGSAPDEAAFKARYSDGTMIHAWEVTREASKGIDNAEAMNAMSRTEQVVIYGYMSFKNGVSEPVFQALIDSICAVFDPLAGRQLGGTCYWSGPLEVDGPKFARLGNYLVHFVRMTYPVTQFPIQ
jgi:hypothetical protein